MGDKRQRREWGLGAIAQGPEFCAHPKFWSACWRRAAAKVAEPADKPGSVVGNHSSRRSVTATLKQPTRRHRGPRHSLPIWSCSRWGLPCRSVARLAVRSYRTVSPLPRTSCDAVRRSTLCCTFRRLAPPRGYLAPCPVEPGLSSAPRHDMHDWMTRLPGRLRHWQCSGAERQKAEIGNERREWHSHCSAGAISDLLLDQIQARCIGLVPADRQSTHAAIAHSGPSLPLFAVQRLARCAAEVGGELGGGGRRQVFD